VPLEIVYLGLGGNIGDTAAIVNEVVETLRGWEGVSAVRLSPLFRSSPVGGVEQPDFVNGVVQLKTTVPPEPFMQKCWALEKQYGVKKAILNGPRALDIDLLFYGAQRIHTETLQVPHPRWDQRLFVLCPLRTFTAEIGGVQLDRAIEVLKGGSDQSVVLLC